MNKAARRLLFKNEVVILFADHFFWTNPKIKFFCSKMSKLYRCFFERGAIGVGGIRNFGCLVIADFGVQGSDKHQGVVQLFFNHVMIWCDALGAMLIKTHTSVTE